MHRPPHKTVYASRRTGFCVTWTKRQGDERTNGGQWFDVSPCHRQDAARRAPRSLTMASSHVVVYLSRSVRLRLLSSEMIVDRATHCQWNRALSSVAEKYGRCSNVASPTIWQLSISQVILTKAFTAVSRHRSTPPTFYSSTFVVVVFPYCRHTPHPCFPCLRHCSRNVGSASSLSVTLPLLFFPSISFPTDIFIIFVLFAFSLSLSLSLSLPDLTSLFLFIIFEWRIFSSQRLHLHLHFNFVEFCFWWWSFLSFGLNFTVLHTHTHTHTYPYFYDKI